MRLRPRRRHLVGGSPSVGLADTCGATGLRPLGRSRRIRRCVRTGVLLTVIGLMRLARAMRSRWRPLLAGGVLTVVGVMLRSGPWGVVLLPGLLFLASVLLIPASPDADRKWRSELERELAGYSTPAQRRDLEATLDRYPDSVTYELRGILANQAMATGNNGIPGCRRR
jgi:hypothetical protein